MRKPAPYLIFLLLLAACFSLATLLQPRAAAWDPARAGGSVLTVLLGDSRRMFASQLFVQADVSFHSGYYPSIFDQAQAPKDSRHMTAREGTAEAEEHERRMNFMGPPRDWIEGFGRNFLITDHTHLEGAKEGEMLPWLKLSADLDPQRIDTYTVAAYWLRTMGKATEAERFLHEGLRNNPGSYELLFELGMLYQESYHDRDRARKAWEAALPLLMTFTTDQKQRARTGNLWEIALERCRELEVSGKQPDLLMLEKIALHLARLEEQNGHYAAAIGYLQVAAKASPQPQVLLKQISELRQRLPAPGTN